MVARNPPRHGAASGADSDGRTAAAPGSDQKGNWPRGFDDAAAEYMAALIQISARLQEKLRTALEELYHTPREGAQSSLNEDVANSYRDLNDAIQKQDVGRINSIQASYLSRVQAAYGEAEAIQRSRLTEYVNALQAAWQAAQTEIGMGFQTYLNSVKNNFAELPSGGVDPATVAAIGQSLVTMAGHAYYVAQVVPAAPSDNP
jgi:hypothetical protein